MSRQVSHPVYMRGASPVRWRAHRLAWSSELKIRFRPFTLATLPVAGRNSLPYIPNAFIHDLCLRHLTGGDRTRLPGVPQWRPMHLLPLLTLTRSLDRGCPVAPTNRIRGFDW